MDACDFCQRGIVDAPRAFFSRHAVFVQVFESESEMLTDNHHPPPLPR